MGNCLARVVVIDLTEENTFIVCISTFFLILCAHWHFCLLAHGLFSSRDKRDLSAFKSSFHESFRRPMEEQLGNHRANCHSSIPGLRSCCTLQYYCHTLSHSHHCCLNIPSGRKLWSKSPAAEQERNLPSDICDL
jgi:hypothetical protein